MSFGNRNIYSRESFQFNVVQFKKYQPPGNLKFKNLGIFQSLKLRFSVEKILSISLKLNFIPNSWGSNGLGMNESKLGIYSHSGKLR